MPWIDDELGRHASRAGHRNSATAADARPAAGRCRLEAQALRGSGSGRPPRCLVSVLFVPCNVPASTRRKPCAPGTTHTLPDSAAVHVTRVLRLAAGDPITLFDGTGMDYDAVLRESWPAVGVSAEVGTGRRVDRESPLAITLLQGVSRGPRMDTVMQKATELGVRIVQPVLAERSVVRLDAERGAGAPGTLAAHRHQCLRAVRALRRAGDPASTVASTRPWPMLEPGTVGLTLDPEGTVQLAELLGAGPAGGTGYRAGRRLYRRTRSGRSPEAGFRGLRLGPRILRTETAPLAALAILQYARGDLGSRRRAASGATPDTPGENGVRDSSPGVSGVAPEDAPTRAALRCGLRARPRSGPRSPPGRESAGTR